MTIDPQAMVHEQAGGLMHSPALLEAVLGALDEHAIVAITDRAGRILHANRKFCELSGYPLQELLGRDHRILSSGQHSREFMKHMWSTIGHGRIWRGTFCNRAKNGNLYWVQSTIVPILGDNGRPESYVALRTDVSDLKSAEQALSRSEQRFRNLFEQSADALLLLDIDQGIFIDGNAAAARMLGLPSVEAVAGHAPAAFSPPLQPDGQTSESKATAMMEAAREQGSHRFEWWHCSDCREPFPVEVVLTVLKRDSGTLALTTWRDISERKRAEAWQAHYTSVLDGLSRDEPPRELFDRILRFAHAQAPALRLAAYAIASGGQRVLDIAAPDLPDKVRDTPLNCPNASAISCCPLQTAPADGDPEPCRCLIADCPAVNALPGLQLLRLQPILARGRNEVLGNLAVFVSRPSPLEPEEESVLARSLDLLALVIERIRNREQTVLAEVVFRESQQAIALTDANGNILTVNRSFELLCAVDADEVIGSPILRFLPAAAEGARQQEIEQHLCTSSRWHGELDANAADGRHIPVLYSLSAISGEQGHKGLRIHVLADLSDSRRQAEQIERLAYFDELTCLPNRNLLNLRLGEMLAAAHIEEYPLALLCIDLDRFKEVNETRGHHAGDHALSEVARRFRQRLGEGHFLARTGGDEFAVILERTSAQDASSVADTLLHSLRAPLSADGHSFTLGASIGIALFPQDGNDAGDLLREADIAMYRAKSVGGGHCFYSEGMGSDLQRQLGLATRLTEAIADDRLQLHYQPLIRLRDRRMVAAEALLRWHDEREGWISPSEFVPVAEARHMMPQLGLWVFRHACRQVQQWRNAGLRPPLLAINLSALQFVDPQLPELLASVLREYGLTADCFELELTESSIVVDSDAAIRLMDRLAGQGFSLAIDDFGTGYSSLSYLKRFPARKLKIDMSFVREMLVDRSDHAIVETIIAMAETLQLKTVAEGVETSQQADALARLGCDCAQGWYFAPALPPETFRDQWLRRDG